MDTFVPPTRVVIVGPGRVGRSFAVALRAAGYDIVAVIGRADPLEPIANADLVIIAVPDAALGSVVRDVAALAAPDALIVHTCGLEGLAVFAGRPRVGCLHPATPISTRDQTLTGVFFAVTSDAAAAGPIASVINAVGGVAMSVADEDRARYHAALVHASNHLVALAADAASLLGDAHSALSPLLQQTVDNIATLGPAAALTGPVSRGDAATVRAHLAALPAPIAASYRANARRALALAHESGRLTDAAAAAVLAVLDDGDLNEDLH